MRLRRKRKKEEENSYNATGFYRLVAYFLVVVAIAMTQSESSWIQSYMATNFSFSYKNFTISTEKRKNDKTFFILEIPELTDWILGNSTELAKLYYDSPHTLNEDQGELWLYRAFQEHPSRTLDPDTADVFLVCACLHLNHYLTAKPAHKAVDVATFAHHTLPTRLVNTSKPHLLAVPTTNPTTSIVIGIKSIVDSLIDRGIELWSFGYERNTFWQRLPPKRIIPIPYVARLSPEPDTTTILDTARISDFVFYSGDRRGNAIDWAGCDRQMVAPLANEENMDIRLSGKGLTTSIPMKGRMSQDEYNHRMTTSDYCLVVCGDTPTSRSLVSAVLFGCIPFRIGSRLRGECIPPCRLGWGWTISGIQYPHLPYRERINWTLFPEVDEAEFAANPAPVLHSAMSEISPNKKKTLRTVMKEHREGFIYGWGSPVDARKFGKVADYGWESFLDSCKREKKGT